MDEALNLPAPEEKPAIAGNTALLSGNPEQGLGMTIAQHNALQLARTDPMAVATVVRNWVNGTNPDNPA